MGFMANPGARQQAALTRQQAALDHARSVERWAARNGYGPRVPPANQRDRMMLTRALTTLRGVPVDSPAVPAPTTAANGHAGPAPSLQETRQAVTAPSTRGRPRGPSRTLPVVTVTFVEALPPKESGIRPSRYAAALEQLRRRPGQWALMGNLSRCGGDVLRKMGCEVTRRRDSKRHDGDVVVYARIPPRP